MNNKHYGQIVEHVIRENGFNLTELARLCFVNRRSLYNWFEKKYLNPDIIYRIGSIIQHDFSVEFPELFATEDFGAKKGELSAKAAVDLDFFQAPDAILWKDKYIQLMEKYQVLLTLKLENEIDK